MLDMLTRICVAFCNEHMEEMLQNADISRGIAHSAVSAVDEQLNGLWKDLAAKEQKLLIALGGIVGFAVSGIVLIGTLL